jgi:hypothetical protein
MALGLFLSGAGRPDPAGRWSGPSNLAVKLDMRVDPQGRDGCRLANTTGNGGQLQATDRKQRELESLRRT